MNIPNAFPFASIPIKLPVLGIIIVIAILIIFAVTFFLLFIRLLLVVPPIRHLAQKIMSILMDDK